jgi:hypothetical protein
MAETCANCRAVVEKCGRDPEGRPICCAACLFHPLGCRCRFGELGVAETRDYGDFEDFEEDR